MKRISVLLLVGVLLLCGTMALFAEGQTETETGVASEAEREEIRLTLGTSSAGGSWYPATQVMARIIQEEMPYVSVTVMPGGSISNVKGTSGGQYDIALAHTQDIATALAGEAPFESKVTNIKGLMNLWTNYVQFGVRKNSDIYSISDLEGKRLCPGNKGWGGEIAAQLVLSLYGLTYDDLSKVEFTGWSGMVDLYKDRHIDCGVACSTLGVSAFQEMAQLGDGLRVLPLSEEAIAEGMRKNQGYFKNILPAGAYRGVEEDVPTLGSTTILFARDDLDDELMYNIVKVLIARKDELVSALKAFEELTIEFAPKIPAVDIHPGAAKYYKEMGVLN
ncbi:MAG: TAXI family TRAP transporter solute-binding subunit [Spirochaetota bacterium]|nr:TAXI family TRAP transporter solute-binding subunit [Spirochaetota bacterium]